MKIGFIVWGLAVIVTIAWLVWEDRETRKYNRQQRADYERRRTYGQGR